MGSAMQPDSCTCRHTGVSNLHSPRPTSLGRTTASSREVIPADRAVVAGRTKRQRATGGPPGCPDPQMQNCLLCRCPDQPSNPAGKVYQTAARGLFSRVTAQAPSWRKAPGLKCEDSVRFGWHLPCGSKLEPELGTPASCTALCGSTVGLSGPKTTESPPLLSSYALDTCR